MTFDALAGLILVAALAAALVATAKQQGVADARLAETRAAARLAEAVLLSLQTDQPSPQDETATILVEPDPAPSPPGWSWARVSVQMGTNHAELTGLVRQSAPATRPATGGPAADPPAGGAP
jgi:type II secretory pathway pseudopilin PulG